MAQTRFYSSVAPQTTLAAGIGPSDVTCNLISTTGLPGSFPFTLALDYGGATEELVDVTNLSGTIATIVRAVDGTAAASHASGAFVRHVSSARDFTAANVHQGASSAVHGVTGNVVGDTDTQTLSNKTLTSPTINGGSLTNAAVNTASVVSISSASTSVVPLSSNSPSGQTADLQDWKVNNSILSKIDSAGIWRGPAVAINGTNPAINTLSVTGAAAQSVYILSVANTAGSPIFSIDKSGNAQVLPTDTGAGNTYLYVQAPLSGSTSAKMLQLVPTTGGAAFTVTNDNPLLATAPTVQSTALSVTNGSANTTGLIVNSTSTAALLADLQKSGTSKFNVDQNGNATAVGTSVGTNVSAAAVTYTPTIGGSALTLGNGVVSGRYSIAGGAQILQIRIVAGTTTTLAASGSLTFTLPTGVQGSSNDASGTGYFTKTAGGSFNLGACSCSASAGTITFYVVRQTDLTFQSFNTTNGAAVANGSIINLSVMILP